MNLPRTTAFAFAVLASTAALAVNPVGAWTGRFLFKAPTLPPNAPVAQRAKLASAMAMIQKGRMHLTLKADKSYTMHIVGLPMFGKPDTTGTWSQTGAGVTLKQAGASDTPRTLQLDPSGKQMSLTLGKSGARVVFTR